MKNDVNALREILFDTLKQLKDPANPMDLDRAKTIAEVAETVISSAKVEVAFARELGAAVRSRFMPEIVPAEDKPEALPAVEAGVRATLTGGVVETRVEALPPGITSVSVHTMD